MWFSSCSLLLLDATPVYDPQNAGFVSGQLMDLANKLQEAGGKMGGSRSAGSYTMPEKKKEETPLAKCCRDG